MKEFSNLSQPSTEGDALIQQLLPPTSQGWPHRTLTPQALQVMQV